MKLVPTPGRLVLSIDEEANQTKSGLIVKEADDAPSIGTVEAFTEVSFDVEIGDKIIFAKYSPDVVEVEEIEYHVVEEEDVLAIINV